MQNNYPHDEPEDPELPTYRCPISSCINGKYYLRENLPDHIRKCHRISFISTINDFNKKSEKRT